MRRETAFENRSLAASSLAVSLMSVGAMRWSVGGDHTTASASLARCWILSLTNLDEREGAEQSRRSSRLNVCTLDTGPMSKRAVRVVTPDLLTRSMALREATVSSPMDEVVLSLKQNPTHSSDRHPPAASTPCKLSRSRPNVASPRTATVPIRFKCANRPPLRIPAHLAGLMRPRSRLSRHSDVLMKSHVKISPTRSPCTCRSDGICQLWVSNTTQWLLCSPLSDVRACSTGGRAVGSGVLKPGGAGSRGGRQRALPSCGALTKLMDSSVPSSLGGCLPSLSASARLVAYSSIRTLAWPPTISANTDEHQSGWNGGWRTAMVLRCGIRAPHSKATARGIRLHMRRTDGSELTISMCLYCLAACRKTLLPMASRMLLSSHGCRWPKRCDSSSRDMRSAAGPSKVGCLPLSRTRQNKAPSFSRRRSSSVLVRSEAVDKAALVCVRASAAAVMAAASCRWSPTATEEHVCRAMPAGSICCTWTSCSPTLV
mmetsp:Transcript_9115/g.26240  ORF Transcript_9115/g.26240 Transcript_9115/m.26240 type:complete len:487 (-) Transcript_9115:339-1799(-)